MPDVRNIDKEKAVEILEQEHLQAKLIEDYSDTFEEGKITAQGVNPGSSVPRNYIVTLTVSKGKDPNATTEAATQPTTHQQVTVTQAPPKKSVSVPVMPEFDALNLNPDEENPAITVKVVAKTSDGSRTVIENTYNKSDFPFTVNDQIDKKTTYEIYFNNTLIKSVDENY